MSKKFEIPTQKENREEKSESPEVPEVKELEKIRKRLAEVDKMLKQKPGEISLGELPEFVKRAEELKKEKEELEKEQEALENYLENRKEMEKIEKDIFKTGEKLRNFFIKEMEKRGTDEIRIPESESPLISYGDIEIYRMKEEGGKKTKDIQIDLEGHRENRDRHYSSDEGNERISLSKDGSVYYHLFEEHDPAMSYLDIEDPRETEKSISFIPSKGFKVKTRKWSGQTIYREQENVKHLVELAEVARRSIDPAPHCLDVAREFYHELEKLDNSLKRGITIAQTKETKEELKY